MNPYLALTPYVLTSAKLSSGGVTLDPELARRVLDLCRSLDQCYIASAVRTYEEQDYLYRGWIERRPGFNPANPPGLSLHEKGLAVDISLPVAQRHLLADAARERGLIRPHLASGEWWHLELDPTWEDDMPLTDDDVERVARRVKALMDEPALELVQADDGDPAIWLRDGTAISWVRDGNALGDMAGYEWVARNLDGSPFIRRITRRAIDALSVVQPCPYDEVVPWYTGPRTT